jgi:hypothetical protein
MKFISRAKRKALEEKLATLDKLAKKAATKRKYTKKRKLEIKNNILFIEQASRYPGGFVLS